MLGVCFVVVDMLFFFKQKTAYELRISDWSSDVCSSDLGLEAEITVTPIDRLVLGLNGSLNDAQVTKLTASEAAISGAVKNARLASPHLQGSFFGSYGYDLPSDATVFTSFQVQHVGTFPNRFPKPPGQPGPPTPPTKLPHPH